MQPEQPTQGIATLDRQEAAPLQETRAANESAEARPSRWIVAEIDPHLKKNVMKLAEESGLNIDEFVNGFVGAALERAVSATTQPRHEPVELLEKDGEGLNSILSKILRERENPAALEVPAR